MTTTAAEPGGNERRVTERAQATHAALVEVAADLFAENGYAQTSMRDIERRGPVSMGAIYSHFKNKAELLVEAIHRRITDDLEARPADAGDAPVELVERLTEAARAFPQRRRLRALLVQAAAASQTDDDTKSRVRAAQDAHMSAWIAGYYANRERLGIDPGVDIETAVRYTWAVELGLGVLEAFGMEPRDADHWADIQHRLARSLLLPVDSTP